MAFVLVGIPLPQGTALEMGPGYFPRQVAWLALVVGLLLVLRSLRRDGPPLLRLRWRPLLATVCAVLVFGWSVGQLGLLITAPITLIIASLGAARPSLLRLALLVVLVTAGASLVFVQLLGLTIPLLPGA